MPRDDIHGTPKAFIPERVAERLRGRMVASGGGCIVTTYATNRGGYGIMGWRDGGVHYQGQVHRIAWIIEYGEIPDGMTVHHKCFNRACVNPDHLALMEHAENARRTRGDDWPVGTCKRGHPPERFQRVPGMDHRVCLDCRLTWNRRAVDRYQARKRRERDANSLEIAGVERDIVAGAAANTGA